MDIEGGEMDFGADIEEGGRLEWITKREKCLSEYREGRKGCWSGYRGRREIVVDTKGREMFTWI